MIDGATDKRDVFREIGVLLGAGIPWDALTTLTVDELGDVIAGHSTARAEG